MKPAQQLRGEDGLSTLDDNFYSTDKEPVKFSHTVLDFQTSPSQSQPNAKPNLMSKSD